MPDIVRLRDEQQKCLPITPEPSRNQLKLIVAGLIAGTNA